MLEVPSWLLREQPVPSMNQSLWVTTDLYELMHFGIGRLDAAPDSSFWRHAGAKVLTLGADLVTLSVPGFLGWQHEEWHRAVLARHGISSHDGIYELKLFSSTTSVDQIDDADLSRLKREAPADMVRLAEAGIEGNYELATQLHKVQFFQGTQSWHAGTIALLYLINTNYLHGCATSSLDSELDAHNAAEGADVSKRDFAGPDCTTWVYDLFRRDEPYEARGVHPSGVGVDRYRKFSELAPEEQRYLRVQRNLSLLNLLDPAMLGFVRFGGGARGEGWEWSANVRHELTSFGYDVSLQAFVRRQPYGVFARFHGYANHDRFFPGVELEVVRLPLRVAGVSTNLSARGALWLQPREQRFFGTEARAGGLLGVRLAPGGRSWVEPFLEVEAKTAGWVAGNAYLEPAATARFGASFAIR